MMMFDSINDELQIAIPELKEYFHTDDLAKAMAEVKKLGYRIILERLDIIGFGAAGLFIDDMGDCIGLWEIDNPTHLTSQ